MGFIANDGETMVGRCLRQLVSGITVAKRYSPPRSRKWIFSWRTCDVWRKAIALFPWGIVEIQTGNQNTTFWILSLPSKMWYSLNDDPPWKGDASSRVRLEGVEKAKPSGQVGCGQLWVFRPGSRNRLSEDYYLDQVKECRWKCKVQNWRW